MILSHDKCFAWISLRLARSALSCGAPPLLAVSKEHFSLSVKFGLRPRAAAMRTGRFFRHTVRQFIAWLAFILGLFRTRTSRLTFVVDIDGLTYQGLKMATIARTHAPFTLNVKFWDETKQTELPSAPPAWAVTDTGLVSLAVAADGMSAVATLSGVAGSVSVTALADGVTVTLALDIEALPIVGGEITIAE